MKKGIFYMIFFYFVLLLVLCFVIKFVLDGFYLLDEVKIYIDNKEIKFLDMWFYVC